MAKTQKSKSRRKSARYRAALKAKHTKQRMRKSGMLRKRRSDGRLRR